MQISPIFFTLAMIAVFALSACSDKLSSVEFSPRPESVAVIAENSQTSMALTSASTSECPSGGSVITLFKDLNSNGQFETTDTLISSTPICNGLAGASGTNGAQGPGSGILLSASTPGSCPAGGTLITTFQDLNNNGAFDQNELLTSTSTVCNGTNGTHGTNGSSGASSIITTSAATLAQCSAGGVVYTTHVDGSSPVSNVICNGTNGTNGNHGQSSFVSGQVGSKINSSFTACHHDYLYIPDSYVNGRGWLIFRHQRNGSADQGIGSTGFNLWNVDIADFFLVSEVGNVTYCQLHWEPSSKQLTYLVLSKEDGVAGEQGKINLK